MQRAEWVCLASARRMGKEMPGPEWEPEARAGLGNGMSGPALFTGSECSAC